MGTPTTLPPSPIAAKPPPAPYGSRPPTTLPEQHTIALTRAVRAATITRRGRRENPPHPARPPEEPPPEAPHPHIPQAPAHPWNHSSRLSAHDNERPPLRTPSTIRCVPPTRSPGSSATWTWWSRTWYRSRDGGRTPPRWANPREVDEFGAVGRKPWARRVDRSPTTRSNVGRPTLGLEKIRTLHIRENYPLNSTTKAPRKETPGENGAGPNR